MRALGICSGTSFDAVEALVVDFDLDAASGVLEATLVEHRSVPYPPSVRDSIAVALPPAPTTLEAVCQLDVAIGQAFAAVAGDVALVHGPLDVICSHGQTVFHWVEGRVAKGSLQLGEPAWIAEQTGATVVSNVRNRDISAGGQGAPLASLLDVLLLASRSDITTGSLNLGGISNVTVIRPGQEPLAWDTGPANALIDAATEWVSEGREHYDRGGALAREGRADPSLVERLLDDPYFSLPPPKSTGKELFNLGYLVSRLGDEQYEARDLLASITAATAESIGAALRPYDLSELFVAGGGTRNPTFMDELRKRLPGVEVRGTAQLGVPEAAKEALLFALIGFFTVCGFPATIPSCTGATHSCVLGSITPGSSPLPPAPGGPAPTRLVVR